MEHALCTNCAQDKYLKKIIEDADEELECSECGELTRPAISLGALAAEIEPIMRAHFRPGAWGHDGVQAGDSLGYIVNDVLGQEVSFVNELVREIIDLDPADPRDGDDPLWADYLDYVQVPISVRPMYERWRYTLEELKYSRRFFSEVAAELFDELFSGLNELSLWESQKWQPVAFELPAGSELFRARVCISSEQRKTFFGDPLTHLGPPPSEFARPGRMNADGVSVLYCALSDKTAIAEMRPAIGMELICVKFLTTRTVRVLNFALLEKARGQTLSYLQPDFAKQVERNQFLRKLHELISQPITPGHEADYLITQTMAEYLSHVKKPPFEGIQFRSAQHDGGTNVVLFRNSDVLAQSTCDGFPIAYAPDNLQVHHISGISYAHEVMDTVVRDNGEVVVFGYGDASDEDDDFDA